MSTPESVSEIYKYNNVWIDWGALSEIFKLRSSDSSKYDFVYANEMLSKVLDILESEEGIASPRLFLGFQNLEANLEPRKEFLRKLFEDNNQLYLAIPDNSGFEAIHWLYVLVEAMVLLILYYQGYPNEEEVRHRMLESVVSDCNINATIKPLSGIDFNKNKILGHDFKDIVDRYKGIYKDKKVSEIYSLEKEAMSKFIRDMAKQHLPKFTKFLFKKETEEEINKIMEEFTESDYFSEIRSVEIFLNLFVGLMCNRRGWEITDSERQDLVGIVEASVFCDVCYSDKRIVKTWDFRANNKVVLDLRTTGTLLNKLNSR